MLCVQKFGYLIKDCDYHAKKMAQPIARNHAHRGSAVVPKFKVTRPRHAAPIVTKTNSPIRRHITRSPSPKASNSPPRVTAVKALVGNPQHALKDNGVINSGCSRHMIENMSYLSDFEELNGRYVAFRGNPQGDDYSRFTWVFFLATKDETSPILKTFITCLENQLSLKNRVLVTKPHNKTPYELLHDRTPSIGFMRPFDYLVTILNTLDSLDKFDGKVDEGFLVGYYVSSKPFRVFNNRTRIVQETLHVNFLENKPNVAEKGGEEIDQQYVFFSMWSSGSTNPHNNDGDAAFDGKEPKFDKKKREYKVNVSLSSSAQSRKQDDKTKKEAKGKNPVESFTGYRDLSAEFEDYSDNSICSVLDLDW
nr:retrovirus-related Pol polyprotein from transposon TNT 1-94 [Tanacetum cinerariifolium]